MASRDVTRNQLAKMAGDDPELIRTLERTISGQRYPTSVTGDVSLTTEQRYALVDATNGAVTVTLPRVTEALGLNLNIKKTDSSGNKVTIVGTIDGDTNFDLLYKDEVVRLYCDGSGWYIM